MASLTNERKEATRKDIGHTLPFFTHFSCLFSAPTRKEREEREFTSEERKRGEKEGRRKRGRRKKKEKEGKEGKEEGRLRS